MRVAAFLSLFFAPVLAAQPVLEDDWQPRRPTSGQQTVMAFAGGAAGVAAVVAAGAAVNGSDRTSVAIVVAAYPLGVATAVALVGTGYGFDVPFAETLTDAVVGTVVGGAAAALSGAVVGGVATLVTGGGEYNFMGLIAGGAVAVVVAATVPPLWTARRVALQPATFATPSGDTGHGLSLRIAL